MRAPFVPKIGDIIRCKDTKATDEEEYSANNIKLLDEKNAGTNPIFTILANFSSYVYYGKQKRV